jgi:hypothetical protein
MVRKSLEGLLAGSQYSALEKELLYMVSGTKDCRRKELALKAPLSDGTANGDWKGYSTFLKKRGAKFRRATQVYVQLEIWTYHDDYSHKANSLENARNSDAASEDTQGQTTSTRPKPSAWGSSPLGEREVKDS